MARRVFGLVADPMRIALVAEYATPEALLAAARRLRELGYRRLDAYTPYPLEELEETLAVPRTRIPRVTLAAGVIGAVFAYLVQWYCNTYDYPIAVGGRPMHPALSYMLITFETTVLFAGLATFVAYFAAGRMPEPWSPLFEVEGFERVTLDRFWLGVDGRDERFDRAATAAALAETGALQVVAPPTRAEVEGRRTAGDLAPGGGRGGGRAAGGEELR